MDWVVFNPIQSNYSLSSFFFFFPYLIVGVLILSQNATESVIISKPLIGRVLNFPCNAFQSKFA